MKRIVLILPIAVFFVYFFALRYDIPWFDEYENIPYFLQQFLDATTFTERFNALLKPNNEHRVLYARLVVLGQYWLTGGLSFEGLMLWGNLGLVLIFWLLYRSTQTEIGASYEIVGASRGTPPTVILPVTLMLFTAQNYLLTFTAIYTLQYLAIIMLVMSTFYVLALDKPGAFAGALALGALATFSMGNGLLLWPAGVAMLVIRRRWVWLGVWAVVGAVCIWLYFRNYPVQQGNAEGFNYVLAHPFQTLAGFFIFAGSLFDFFPTWSVERRAALPLVMGVIIVGILGYWLVQVVIRFLAKQSTTTKPAHFQSFLTGVSLFLLANMALIAVFRIRFYFGMVLHSSYRTYALVLTAVAYLALMSLLSPGQQKRWVPRLWVLFLFVNVLTYVTYVPEAIQRRKHMQGLTFNQRHNQIGLGGTQNSPLARWIIELDSTMRVRNWHTLPSPAITPDEVQLLQVRGITRDAPNARTQFGASRGTPPTLRIADQPDYINIESDQPDYTVGLNRGTYVVFWPQNRDTQAYVLFAEQRKPTGINPFSRPNGWLASMPKALLPPGRYTLGLFLTTPETSRIVLLDNQVDIR